MWTCPKCQHSFYNKNQSHSCGGYTVDDFLTGKPVKSVDLFNLFLAAYGKTGAFKLHPVKTRVALLTKMRFCSINKIGINYIDIHLVLIQPFENTQCFYKIDNLANRFFVHHCRIYDKDDITVELRNIWRWLMRLAIGSMLPQKVQVKPNLPLQNLPNVLSIYARADYIILFSKTT